MELKKFPAFKILVLLMLFFVLWFSFDAKNAAGAAANPDVAAFPDADSASRNLSFGQSFSYGALVYNSGRVPLLLKSEAPLFVECDGSNVTALPALKRGEQSFAKKDLVAALKSDSLLPVDDFTAYSGSVPALDAANYGKYSECVLKMRVDAVMPEGFEKELVLAAFPSLKTKS